MKALLVSMTISLGLIAASGVHAQAPAAAPAGSTGMCKDGTYSSADAKKGACRGHKGVKDWYAASAAAPAANDAAAPAPAKKTRKSKNEAAAEAPVAAAAPAGSTGLCKDGTYSSADAKKGACRGHKGVKDWYGAAAAAPTRTTAPMPSAPAAAPAPTASKMTPAPMAPAAPASKMPAAPTTHAPMVMPTVPAAGGGNGKVWVNNETKVYHCEGDRYYGRTKKGEYMSEGDAVAKGARPSHGDACAK